MLVHGFVFSLGKGAMLDGVSKGGGAVVMGTLIAIITSLPRGGGGQGCKYMHNTSSLGHLIEWIEGVNSMIQNPMGIGIAMSGNANGVDQAIKIGGENQFLIYGVQMGFLGLLIYISILFKAIKNGLKVFELSKKQHIRSISFVAALTKIGLLIPLFTANAELYLFVAFISWFLIGFIESYYLKNILNRNIQ